ncbi:MAG TPA: NUDIX hydrolase [Gammaproteobacteria bacterium]|nr:NUDIX hydrolase [Gammaproteobacteria bacterium]
MSDEDAARVLFGGEYLRLLRRRHWEYAERTNSSGVVVIVAVTPEKKLLLVEQFRWPVASAVIELPAGLVGDVDGDEDLSAAARRELIEETGFEAGEMRVLLSGPVTAGLSNEVTHFCLARDLRRVGEGGGDASEDIRVHEVALAEVPGWLASRPPALLVDPKTYIGLWLYAAYAGP